MTTGEKFEKVADAVYDKGKYDEWSDFWDEYQVNGARTNYGQAFGTFGSNASNYWNDVSYKPKHDMYPTYLDRAYRTARITDLAAIHERLGIVFDTSKCTDFTFSFAEAPNMTHLPEISCVSTNDVYYAFAQLSNVHTIDKIIVNDTGNTKFTGSFNDMRKLVNIEFEGVIGQTISFSSCPLSNGSMKSVITHLKNYAGSGSEGVYTVTFTSACWTNLEASGKPFDDGLTDDETLTWKDYVMDSLGWLT